jgi:predicted aldo/keto reductase-like oxidoreductase
MAATGTGLASRIFSQSLPVQENKVKEKKFVYRTLGNTGIKIPIVSMGTGNTSNPALVRSAIDEGVKLLATAEAYQNGNNEKMVGTVLKNLPRDSFMIMTNCLDIKWFDTKTGIFNSEFNHKSFMERVDASLSRLEVDYVDIFIQPFAAKRKSVFHEPAVKAMEAIKKSGKAKYIGIATHKDEPEAIRAAVDVGIHDIIMTSYNFLKSNREDLDDAIQYAAEAGLGIIAMKTMAGAFWDKERTKPINTLAALKWVLQNENIHTTVPDCSSYDQLNQDLAIMSDLELTEEEKRDLETPSDKLSSGIFCQQCNLCIPQCPENLDIPTIMRSYMYAYGHRNLAHAQNTLCSSGLSSVPCNTCNDCTVKCQMGFDIRTKILDIARLKNVPEDFFRNV